MIRRILRIGAVLAALGMAAGLGGVAWLVVERNKSVVLPAPTGPYPVGRVEYDWVDPSRADPLAPARGVPRELVVWIWYPAAPEPGAPSAPYLPAAWVAARAADRGIGAILWQNENAVRTHSVQDAPLALDRPRYPVIVFSPGYGSLPTDYTVLAEDLASHGYIVAGLANTFSAPVVVFPDGRTVRRTRAGSLPESSPQATRQAADQLVEVWASDVIQVMDRLAALDRDPHERWQGRLDLDHLGVMGHSFGGAASAEACLIDARCQAGLDLDGTLYGHAASQGVRQPFLFVSASQDQGQDDGFRPSLANGALWIAIHGARHFNFVDSSVLFAPVLRLAGVLGPIRGERGLQITRAYTLAFFDYRLRGTGMRKHTCESMLLGPSAEYPEARWVSP